MAKRIIPYPLSAAKISVDFVPFAFWWKPYFFRRKGLNDRARADGHTLWWARWLCFQISYGRML